MILYRPVGLQELTLIYDGGMQAFPARLAQQPIFYPVIQLEYARQTASHWNVQHEQFAGYVTEFKVEDEHIDQFEEHAVGKSQYREFWIPAEDMEEFNRHITGHIKVVEAYFGAGFQGFVPEQFGLQGKNAVEQFTWLANTYLYKRMDFYLELKRNHKAIFLNYPFWQTYEFKNPGLKEKILQAIKEAWLTSFPKIPLPNPAPQNIEPVEQTPVKQTVSRAPAQHFVEPDDEDVTPEEETDPDSFDYPSEEDVTSGKQSHGRPWAEPVDEDVSTEDQTDSDSFEDSLDEDVIPLSQTHADTQSWTDHDDEDALLDEQTESDSFHPLPEDVPVKQTHAHMQHWVSRIQDDSALHKPTNSHFVEGIQLGLSGEYSQAIEELSRAIREEPGLVVAHTSLGVAFHRLGEDDRALACYETALKIDPIYAEAHYFRANILYLRGSVREAIAGYTVAIGLKPELIDAHQKPRPEDRLTDYSLAAAEMRRIAKPAHRILDLNKSLETNPRGANLFKERAAEYYRLRNYAQAIADYSSSLALQPGDAGALHLRGVAYEQLGQSDRALEDYQQAIAIDPQLANEYINRGVAFGQTGNLHQSIASLTDAIRLAPKNPNSYFNRGTVYIQQDDFERAVEDFSRVIQLSPGDEEAYYWRGTSYEAMGRQREAIADYQQFLTLSQDEDAKAQIEQKLSQWNEERQKGMGGQSAVPEGGQKSIQDSSSGEPARTLDLYSIIVALGERALHATWFGRGLDCDGEKAKELYVLTDQDKPIEGRDLLSIASGIRETRAGDFQAFDSGATAPWLFIRVWEGSGFYIETNDPRIKQQLKTHFQSAEEVDGASPSYEGLFIHI